MAPMLGVDWVPSGGLVRIGQSLGVARRKRHEVLCRHESRAAARRSSQSSELGTSGCCRRPFQPGTNIVKALRHDGLFPLNFYSCSFPLSNCCA